jgi:membrane protein
VEKCFVCKERVDRWRKKLMPQSHDKDNRGREAETPGQISKEGWKDILRRTWKETQEDNVDIISAGVAFYSLLAIFPAIAAMISIYGLVADPSTVQQQVSNLQGIMPAEALSIVESQLSNVAEGAGGALTLGLIGGVLVSLWSALMGTKALMTSLTIVNDEQEKRGFVKMNLIALILTIGGILFFLFALALIVVLSALLGNLDLPQTFQWIFSFLRWPILWIASVIVLAVIYRYAPSREDPQWRWVSWGSVAASIMWIIVSALFSLYVTYFGNYNETYGSIGAVVILLMWFYLTAYIILMGEELNTEMERQTRKDTTTGESEPMGKRGAHAADTVG